VSPPARSPAGQDGSPPAGEDGSPPAGEDGSPPAGEDGFTLVDALVSMAIMTAITILFTGAVAIVYRTVSRADTDAAVQSQTAAAFDRLDREIRYARKIFDPEHPAGGDYLVRFVAPDPATGADACVELRLPAGAGSLQERRWPAAEAPAPGFHTVASGLSLTPGDRPGTTLLPFTVVRADTVSNFDRLTVRLTARASANGRAVSTDVDLLFPALNTVSATDRVSTNAAAQPTCG
jgi:hypothetical protein